MKVNGLKTDFAPMRNDGTQIVICYGLKQVEGELYEWHEIYLPKTQNATLSLDIVKTAILNDINSRVKTADLLPLDASRVESKLALHRLLAVERLDDVVKES